MSAFLASFRKKIPYSEVINFLLIYLSVNSLLLGVELVVRGTSAAVLRVIILFGILVGWSLGRSRIRFWPALVIAVLSGFLLTVLHVSGMGTAIWDLLGGALDYLWRWIFQRTSDPSRLVALISILQARTLAGMTNLSQWVGDLTNGFVIYNQISTLLSWGMILWILSCWFAWTTYRREQPIWGILPAGVLLAILMTYTLQKRFTLVILLGAGLILIGLVNHEIRQRSWE